MKRPEYISDIPCPICQDETVGLEIKAAIEKTAEGNTIESKAARVLWCASGHIIVESDKVGQKNVFNFNEFQEKAAQKVQDPYVTIRTEVDARCRSFDVQVWIITFEPSDQMRIYYDKCPSREAGHKMADDYLDKRTEYKALRRVHEK